MRTHLKFEKPLTSKGFERTHKHTRGSSVRLVFVSGSESFQGRGHFAPGLFLHPPEMLLAAGSSVFRQSFYPVHQHPTTKWTSYEDFFFNHETNGLFTSNLIIDR